MTTLSLRSAAKVMFAVAAALSAMPGATAPYYVVFLRPDPSRKPLEKTEGERVQTAHMANIQKMAADGILAAAGPFDDTPGTISGIFVMKISSLQEAERIAAQDPTVLEHRNTVDVHTWYGPPEIGVEYFRLHKADPATPENMQARPFALFYRGEKWGQGSANDVLLKAHDDYVERLRQQGKLGAAGAVEAPDEMTGIIIFRPAATEEAQKLLSEDPAVKAGVLRVEHHKWWSADHVLPW